MINGTKADDLFLSLLMFFRHFREEGRSGVRKLLCFADVGRPLTVPRKGKIHTE
jgi:hypothetical protein